MTSDPIRQPAARDRAETQGRLKRLVKALLLLALAPLALAESVALYPLAGPDVLLGVAVAERIGSALTSLDDPDTEVLGPEVTSALAAPLVTADGFVSLLALLGGEVEATTDSLAGARLLQSDLGADAVLSGRVTSVGSTLQATFFLARAGGAERFTVSAPEDDPGMLARKATLLLADKLGLARPQAEYDIDLSSPYGDYVRALTLVGGGFLDQALELLQELEDDPAAAALLADVRAARTGEAGRDPARLATMSLNLQPLDEEIALGYFERFAAQSELPVLATWQATLLASADRAEEAGAAFNEAAARYPFGELARAAYALAQGEAGALERLRALAESDDVGVLLGVSLLANLQGAQELEKAALTPLTGLLPDYLYPFERLSFIAFDEDDPLAAAQALAVAVARAPESDLYWTNLGWAYYLLDLFEQSEEASLRAVALDANQYIALYNLGLVRAVQGRLSEAMDAYERAIALDPEVDDEALSDLENARGRYPEEPAVRYALGVLYDQEGRRQEAARAFERFLALGGDSSFAAQARTRIEALRAPPPPLEISPGASLGLGPGLIAAEPYHPGDRVYANFELYTPGAELPSRVEVTGVLEQSGEILAERSLTVEVPRNAIGYVVDNLAFDLPLTLAAGEYRLSVEASASEDRVTSLELPLAVTGKPEWLRQLLGRDVAMLALESGRPLYSSSDLERGDAALIETLVTELRRSAAAAEEALPLAEQGRFAGLSGGEVFEASSAQDVEDFLAYLLAQGTEQAGFTFVDAYAQWALEGAPSAASAE